MPMLLVAPVNGMQPLSLSCGRGPWGGPVQSGASKAAMEAAPRARALRAEVWFVGRARAPALRARRRSGAGKYIIEWIGGDGWVGYVKILLSLRNV